MTAQDISREKSRRETAAAFAASADFLAAAARAFSVTKAAVVTERRSQPYVTARKWVMRELVAQGHTYSSVGRVFKTHHAIVMRHTIGYDPGEHARLTAQIRGSSRRPVPATPGESADASELASVLAMGGADTREAFDLAVRAARHDPMAWREFCEAAYPYTREAAVATPPRGARGAA